jgi:hypothetical protein
VWVSGEATPVRLTAHSSNSFGTRPWLSMGSRERKRASARGEYDLCASYLFMRKLEPNMIIRF